MPGALEFVLAGLILGLVVGLLGGGGGILAVPLLVYVVGVPTDEAVTLSLVVITIAAATGLLTHARAQNVQWRTGIQFGLLGLVGAWVGSLASVRVPDEVLLGTLVVLLLLAAGSMLRPPPKRVAKRRSPLVIVLLATLIGFLVGFVGVGGGFLTIPVLVAALGMPMRQAIGTGLVVMAVNSVLALTIRLITDAGTPDPAMAVPLGVAAGVGAVGGALLSRHLPGRALQVSFGLLAAAVAVATAAEVALR